MINEILDKFKLLEEVEAIAIGGSRATNHHDYQSDYDIYIYINKEIDANIRKKIYQGFTKIMEVKNQYWEEEDNIVLNDGIPADIIYRHLDDFSHEIEEVVTYYKPHNCYTTCMWHNLINCQVIYDKEGKLAKLQQKFMVPYPEKLANNIIERSMNLLKDALPNYYDQIKKAVNRRDLNSINHRVSEFLASYFDVIFATNRLTHPGEKRLIEYAKTNCPKLPIDFEENIRKVFDTMFDVNTKLLTVLDEIIANLRDII